MFEGQGTFDGPGGENDLLGPNAPEALRWRAGNGRLAGFGQPLGDGDQIMVPVPDGGGPRQDPDAARRKRVQGRGDP